MNYEKLMNNKPTSFGTMVNSQGQTIEFYEHPIHGDESPVICVCHDLKLAESSTFYETDDMKASHQEYEPIFAHGKLLMGFEFEQLKGVQI